MEDENAKPGDKGDSPKKHRTLKDATNLLKAEALKRYRQRHKSSLDRHELALEDEFSKSKKSPIPKSPTITENDEVYNQTRGVTPVEDDVFRSVSQASSTHSNVTQASSSNSKGDIPEEVGQMGRRVEDEGCLKDGPIKDVSVNIEIVSDDEVKKEDLNKEVDVGKLDNDNKEMASQKSQTSVSEDNLNEHDNKRPDSGDSDNSKQSSNKGSKYGFSNRSPSNGQIVDDEDMSKDGHDDEDEEGKVETGDKQETIPPREETKEEGIVSSRASSSGERPLTSESVGDSKGKSNADERADSDTKAGRPLSSGSNTDSRTKSGEGIGDRQTENSDDDISGSSKQDIFGMEREYDSDNAKGSGDAKNKSPSASSRRGVKSRIKSEVEDDSSHHSDDDPLSQTFPLSANSRKGKKGRLPSAALLDGLLATRGDISDSEEETPEEQTQEPTEQATEGGEQTTQAMDENKTDDVEPPLTQEQNTAAEGENTQETVGEATQQEAQSNDTEVKPEQEESKQEHEESKPQQEESKAEQEESKPETEGSKPDQEESKPEQVEAKPKQEESKPEQEEAKPEQEEAKPEQEEAKPEQEEAKPEQEEAKPEQEEAKPGQEAGEIKTEQSESETQQEKSDTKEEAKVEEEVKPQEESSEVKAEQQATDEAQKQDQSESKPEQQIANEAQKPEQSEDKPVESQKEEGATESPEAKAQQEEQKAAPVDGQDPNIRGDEDEVQSQEITGDDEEEKIPDDFYYNFDDHKSKPIITEESGLPQDMLVLNHSYGYDCHKRANLHMLDNDTALFAAGNLAQLINFKTKVQTYLRSTSGGGLGAIAIHPSKKYFAIGEKGTAPNINIFEFPSLKLYRILRGGTQESYSFVDFSPDGKMLASVGGDPDFMLTLWDWKQEKTVLRSKAFSQDVFRVTFSTELEGQLTSSGTGHIRFWKMAKTFTGLKLQGQLGKFGKTEITDIEGYVELPDGKVLSGSEWGNLLLWDGGLIKVEISRKGKKPCHQGVIMQIIMDEGELMTVGADGYIRVWDFETVDTADVTDESSIFEMEPMNELKVGNGVSLQAVVKSADPEEPTMWYAQDANGAIWKLDLSFSFTSQEPDKLMKYHAGQINGCSASPVSDLVATIGQDHFVIIYDYIAQTQLCRARYNAAGTSLLWTPQVVDPKGATILAGFADGVVRVLVFQKKEVVDVHGRKKQNQSEIALKQAFKPHNGNVVCMVIDNKGELLATGSDDNTIFFFSISENYEPIGFIKTPSAVTHLEWSAGSVKKQTLLVSCLNGEVLEVGSPEAGKFDTSHTFEISGLDIRTHQFKSVKSVLRHEEELERKAREEEERKKREAEERRKRIERGLETESEQGDQPEEEEKPKEEEWQPFIPNEPSPVLQAIHGKEPGTFWLSMGEFDSGYLYKCEFQDEAKKSTLDEQKLYHPIGTQPVGQSNDVPIQNIKFTKNGKYAVMGMQNGTIRIQSLVDTEFDPESPHWVLSSHDNQYGKVTNVEMSYDNKFVFSVGADGNFFAYEFMDEDVIEKKVKEAKAKIPSAKKELAEKAINDIEDPSAYSIEDAKQKAEHDKMMKLAEQKKATVRKTIKQMRDQFKKLIDKNTELPEHLRLDRKEFEMDPEIKKELDKQTHEKIETVKKEMAWEEEKHRIALEKLKLRFKDVVECERIVVKAFQSPHEVSSFRASKLPDDFYQAKADMDKRKTTMFSKDGESRQQTQDLLQAVTESDDEKSSDSESQSDDIFSMGLGKDDGKEGADRENTQARVTTTLKGSMGERITKALMKVEEKKKKRAARRAQWSELYSSKPDDNYEDSADVAAIKDAQENMGDYKLKSADDYVVPDHLRMNTDKARARLLVLKELLHKHKYDFNQQLLTLRDKKIRNIDTIKELRFQLQNVQAKLGADQIRPIPDVPRLYPEEIPERKYEYTRETLLKFKASIDAKEKDKGQGKQKDGFSMGAVAEAKSFAFTPSPIHGLKDRQTAAEIEDKMFELTPFAAESVQTPLEAKLEQAELIRLLYEQDRILQEIGDLLNNFDAELKCLRHDKFRLDVDLKNADLRHVTLFEEFLLLRDFEKHENVLVSKLESKEQEKFDMQEKIVQVLAKIEGKKKEIEKLVEKEKALQTTFHASLGDNNKFSEYLTKVFKKKIKRSKKKVTDGDEDEDEDSEEESSDESDWEESDEESDSEAGGYDLDVCPPGCDQNIYDNTCALREKRLDIEEALAELKKDKDACNKEHESFTKKSKIIDSAVKQAENELEAFQLEKQQKLNELDVVVQLKLHQIQHTINNALPQDLSQCLVFEQPGVIRLTHRIKELEHEKGIQKKQMREAKRKHVTLIKDRKLFDAKISVMNETCNKMMIQKFGRIVDLEKLETVTVNRQVEELKEKLRVAEIQCSADVIKWNDKIDNAKDNITDLIKENTNKLDQLNMLVGEKKEYEGALDSRQKNLGDEYGGARKADVNERQRLIQLVHLQAQEVEALKEEITLLSRKGGHILPPAQPPLPQSSQGNRGSLPPN